MLPHQASATISQQGPAPSSGLLVARDFDGAMNELNLDHSMSIERLSDSELHKTVFVCRNAQSVCCATQVSRLNTGVCKNFGTAGGAGAGARSQEPTVASQLTLGTTVP